MKHAAVKFRGKIYVCGPRHQNALNKLFSSWSTLSIHRAYDRVMDGKEDIVFGFAKLDGSDWEESSSQDARKEMYGFK